jgi:hypothetical protein
VEEHRGNDDDDEPNFEGLTPTQIKNVKAFAESDDKAKFLCEAIRRGKKLNNEIRILGRVAYGLSQALADQNYDRSKV